MLDRAIAWIMIALSYGLARLARIFPESSEWLAFQLFCLFAPKEVAQLKLNIQKILGLTQNTIPGRDFVRQCIGAQLRMNLHALQELFCSDPVTTTGFAEYQNLLRQQSCKKRGVIIVSAHHGCWELVAKYSALGLDVPLTVLAKRAKWSPVDEFLRNIRGRAGVSVLWNESKSLVRDMLTRINAGEALGFVMDQKPQHRVGEVYDFLGFPAHFVAGPAAMALRRGSPVVAVTLVNTGGREYLMKTELVWDGELPVKNERDLTARMLQVLEDWIKIYPEQWTWNYRRWKF